MKENQVQFSITPNIITVILNGEIYSLLRKGSDDPLETEKAEKAYQAIKEEDYDSLEKILKPIVQVEEYVQDTFFRVDNKGNVFVENYEEPVHKSIAKKLLNFAVGDFPVEGLINFWINLQNNPSAESKKDLFDFLDKNHHPLTQDGCFLAYKKVTKRGEKYFDSHTKTIPNNVGDIPTMDRNKCNPNRNETCSTGLHVASWEYATGFSGDTLVLVKINPADVVAVPIDYNQQKMRTCSYEVIEIITDNKPLSNELIQVKLSDRAQRNLKEVQKVVDIIKIKKEEPFVGNVSNPSVTFVLDYNLTRTELLNNPALLNLSKNQIQELSNMNGKNKKGIFRKAKNMLIQAGFDAEIINE